jgi:hypothetical protein
MSIIFLRGVYSRIHEVQVQARGGLRASCFPKNQSERRSVRGIISIFKKYPLKHGKANISFKQKLGSFLAEKPVLGVTFRDRSQRIPRSRLTQ